MFLLLFLLFKSDSAKSTISNTNQIFFFRLRCSKYFFMYIQFFSIYFILSLFIIFSAFLSPFCYLILLISLICLICHQPSSPVRFLDYFDISYFRRIFRGRDFILKKFLNLSILSSSFPLSFSLFLSLPPFISLSLLILFIFFSHFLSLSLTFSLSLSLSLSLSISLSVSLSVSLSLSLSFSLPLFPTHA